MCMRFRPVSNEQASICESNYVHGSKNELSWIVTLASSLQSVEGVRIIFRRLLLACSSHVFRFSLCACLAHLADICGIPHLHVRRVSFLQTGWMKWTFRKKTLSYCYACVNTHTHIYIYIYIYMYTHMHNHIMFFLPGSWFLGRIPGFGPLLLVPGHSSWT